MKFDRTELPSSNWSVASVAILFTILLVSKAIHGQTPIWQELLASTDPELRIRGVVTAAQSVGPDALKAVGRGLNDPNAFVRAAARRSLRSKGTTGLDWLMGSSAPAGTSEMVRNANHLLEFFSGINRDLRDQFDSDTVRKILAETEGLRCRENICLEKWMKPDYPPLAYSAAVAGQVWVTFAVDETGKPMQISADGPPLIITAARDAIEKWQFKRGGGPAGSRQIVLVEFQLTEPSSFTREVVSEMIFPNHVLVSAKRLR